MADPISSHPCVTYAPRLGGRRVFVTLTHDRASGRLRSINVAVHTLGAPFRAALDLSMALATELLSKGATVEEVADLLDQEAVGGPGGDVADLEDLEIRWARDVPGLVAKILRLPSE